MNLAEVKSEVWDTPDINLQVIILNNFVSGSIWFQVRNIWYKTHNDNAYLIRKQLEV